MNENDAEKRAREHLAELMKLHPVSAPLRARLPYASSVTDCYWFSVRFPNECLIGGGWVIGVRKTDGVLVYFGPDGGE